MTKLEVEKPGVDIICFPSLAVHSGGSFPERLTFSSLIIIGPLLTLSVNFKISVTVAGSLESPEDISMMSYLIKWSEIDHDDYCLALLFTNRDFPDGALGLAWIADSYHMSSGGICSTRMFFDEKEEAMYLNTAVVTLLNYGARVPRKASVITVAHELGHGFGSEVNTNLNFLDFPGRFFDCI